VGIRIVRQNPAKRYGTVGGKSRIEPKRNPLGRLVSGRERENGRGFHDNGVKIRKGRR